MAVQDKDLGMKRIMQEIRKAHNLEVAVGILSGSRNGEGASIAEYGAYNEFGTKDIPSRPFMAISFDEYKIQIDKDIARQTQLLATGNVTARQALTVIGEKHASRIKTTIKNRDFLPKLAESTIKAKKGSTKTLIDTGALRNSIQISIRKRSIG